MHRFEFSSVLPAEYLEDLEALVFFNPQQAAARIGIERSMEEYGALRICVEDGSLRVTVESLRDVQTLFALADVDDGYDLAGLVSYVRTDIENILVLHIAVTEPFSSTGAYADDMLAAGLLHAVRDAARHLRGVRSVAIMYPAGGPIKMGVRAPKTPAASSA